MAAIDIMDNPVTNGNSDQAKIQPHQVSLMARALQGAARGSVFLQDAVSNAGMKTGSLIGDMLGLPTGSPPNYNPGEQSLIDSGVIDPNMTPPQTFGEKVTQNIGAGVGALMPFLPLKGGTQSLVGSIPAASSTVGAIAAPALGMPYVDKVVDNPYLKTGIGAALSILGGGLGGGLGKLSSTSKLPEYTAGQTLPADSQEAAQLLNKQENLIPRNVEAAQNASDMLNNHNQKLGAALKTSNPTTGDAIAEKIHDAFNAKIAERGENYNAATEQVFGDASKPVNIDDTVDALARAQNETPKLSGGKNTNLGNAINQAFDLVVTNKDNPLLLKKALSDIQHMQSFGGPMELSSQESAALNPIVTSLRNDINRAYPGFKDIQTQYSKDTQDLENLQQGVVGKIEKKADLNPEQVFDNIFLKTSPSRVQQLQDVLGPDLYSQAADTFLQGVGRKNLTPNTKSISDNNPSVPIRKLGDYLRQNQDQLNQTLPPQQQQLVQGLIGQTEQATRGIPSGNFMSQAYTTPNNPIAQLGNYRNERVLPYAVDMVGSFGPRQLVNQLQRNQMLTGQSPMAQTGQALGQGALVSGAMNQPPLTPNQSIPNNAPTPTPQVSQAPSQITPLPDSWKQKLDSQASAPSAFDAFDQKYGLNGVKPSNPNQQDAVNPNGQGPLPQNNDSLSARPTISPQAMQYAMKRLNNGDDSVLYDPEGEYQKFKTSMAPDSPAFMDKVKKIIASRESKGSGDYNAISPNSSALGKYQFIDSTRNSVMPGVSRQDFLNSPDTQEQAMDSLIKSNENTFKNNGIDPSKVAPDDLAGMLMAAHLRGPKAGINAYQDTSYQGIPDANGTLPRDYYDYAKTSFNSPKFDSAPDFNSMSTDDLINYGNKFMAPQQQAAS